MPQCKMLSIFIKLALPPQIEAMVSQQSQAIAIILLLVCSNCHAMPSGNTSNDIDEDPFNGDRKAVDFNTVMGHFKEFCMYLPVIMTTLKESMSGFPKFAEGMRILVSGKGRPEGDECKCHGGNASNELENSSRYG